MPGVVDYYSVGPGPISTQIPGCLGEAWWLLPSAGDQNF